MLSNILTTHDSLFLSTGVEIKIPGVGVTPVAISTTLPAAVVQLSQLGKRERHAISILSYFLIHSVLKVFFLFGQRQFIYLFLFSVLSFQNIYMKKKKNIFRFVFWSGFNPIFLYRFRCCFSFLFHLFNDFVDAISNLIPILSFLFLYLIQNTRTHAYTNTNT